MESARHLSCWLTCHELVSLAVLVCAELLLILELAGLLHPWLLVHPRIRHEASLGSILLHHLLLHKLLLEDHLLVHCDLLHHLLLWVERVRLETDWLLCWLRLFGQGSFFLLSVVVDGKWVKLRLILLLS